MRNDMHTDNHNSELDLLTMAAAVVLMGGIIWLWASVGLWLAS